MDGIVFLQQGGGLEGGERIASAGGAPDEAVAVVIVDALHHVLHRIVLVGPHDHELLLGDDEHHVAADGPAKVALFKEVVGELSEMANVPIGLVSELRDGQETFIPIEGEVAGVVVGEVVGPVAIADDKGLEVAEEGFGVAVAGVVLVFDDLFHGSAGIHAKGFQLDLDAGDAVDEDDDIVAVMTVVRVDAELVNDLEVVFAPVLEIDEGVVEGRAVVAGEGVDGAEGLRGGEDIRGDDFVAEAGELGVSEADAVEGVEFFAEVFLESGAVGDVQAVGVLELFQSRDEEAFDIGLGDDGRLSMTDRSVADGL